MNAKKLLSLAALLTLPSVAGAQSQAQATPGAPLPSVPISLGGYFWVDTGFKDETNTQPSEPTQDTPYMQGRLGLIAGYGKTLGDVKLDAQLEILGLENEFAGSRFEAHILNSFIRIGQKTWDVQIGRFLNSEVFYRGQGIELYTPDELGAAGAPSIYHLHFNRGHQDQPGQIAAHYMPFENVKLELSGVYGYDQSQAIYGVRPMIDVGYAGFRLFAGYEWRDEPSNTDETGVKRNFNGYAARLQYTLPFVTFGVNYSSAREERYNNDEVLEASLSGDRSSIGGFADFFFGKHSVGLGYYRTEFTDERELRNTNSQDQMFASYLYRLPVDGFSIKGVVGYARGDIEDRQIGANYQNDLMSYRVRVAYDFQ
jgi:hypothetical protein